MAEFNHTQVIAASTWSIIHNLNVNETVSDVFINDNGNLEKVIPLAAIHTNSNTLTIKFSTNQTGSIRIVG